MVRRINIDGDDQADRLAHGGEHRAVYVYQLDSYRYWERELGRDDFTYGQFGENFTVEGLADDEVCIGDRYRIGGALFEVTQPRVTCYRLGIRMDEPAMPSLLVAHHRPGFYLRVLEEGPVQAGDAIVKVADGPERLTVAEVDALLYLPGPVARAARARAADPGAQRGLAGQLPRAARRGRRRRRARPRGPGFRPLRVAEVRRESATITSFRLVPADDTLAGPAAAPGQYLTRAAATGRRRAAADPQLLALGPARRARLPDQRQARGRRAAATCTSTSRSATCSTPPRRAASFVLRAGTRPVVLISAGVGATPVLAMLHALAGERSARPVWWLHGARNRDEHAFGAEVDALLAALPGRPPRSSPTAARRPAADTDHDVTGRLDLAALDGPASRPTPTTTSAAPTRFMRAIGAALTARGVAPERVATEAFGAVAVHASGIVKAGDRAPHAPDGRARHRPDDHVRAQQPRRRLGRPLPQPARPRRGLRRPGRLRLPQRRLPQLRERPARRRGRLRHRPARAAARRADPRLLHPSHLRGHLGSVDGMFGLSWNRLSGS